MTLIISGITSTLMSKGHGNVMRLVLAAITDEWQPVVYIAAAIHGEPDVRVNRSAEESTRRACKRLAVQGVVELGYQIIGGDTVFDRPSNFFRKQWLVVRRTGDGDPPENAEDVRRRGLERLRRSVQDG
ncbi:hypothetical protein [Sinorhizobium americanum]|uniref:hypothetical protein n=1 Tax=Sinorhizobium americanum TaxID=194963 RepID=UPI0007D9D599|nr:hypothetical protein [Sinorhizobium americanum]OAP43653.1 hypothetical protein ATC00_02020 [Sinorhizobium americanum]